MDRVQDVARLGALGQARGRPEREHLAALGRRRAVREHEQPRRRELVVKVAQLGGARQRAEVEDRHSRLGPASVAASCSCAIPSATSSRFSSSSISARRPRATMSSNWATATETGGRWTIWLKGAIRCRRRLTAGAPRWRREQYVNVPEKGETYVTLSCVQITPRSPRAGDDSGPLRRDHHLGSARGRRDGSPSSLLLGPI